MEQTESGQKKEIITRELKRKAELLGVIFGLPKPDIISTSVEKMPEKFFLPKEMLSVFENIFKKENSANYEYVTLGDVTMGKLFFGKIKMGTDVDAKPPIKDAIMGGLGRRRIEIHSHGKQQEDVRFSPADIACFLVLVDLQVSVVISKLRNLPDEEYRVLIGIKGRENLTIEKKGLWATINPRPKKPFFDSDYVEDKLEEVVEIDQPLNEVAAIFGANSCAIYVGTGHINRRDVEVYKVHPSKFPEFSQDLRTKLMLPRSV